MKVIDLRKQTGVLKEVEKIVATPTPPIPEKIISSVAEPAVILPKIEKSIEWNAPEFVTPERSLSWYIAPVVFTLGLVIFGIFTKSYFFSAFLLLAFSVLVMYTKKAPREIKCQINEDGVRLDTRVYPFTELKSFWIFDKFTPKELSLQTSKTLMPYIRLPLDDQKITLIKATIGNYLREEEHPDYMADEIARTFGF